MRKTIIGLDHIDERIAKAHHEWLFNYLSDRPHLKRVLGLSQLFTCDDFGLLNYPHLWPSSRIGKTYLAEKSDQNPADILLKSFRNYKIKHQLFGFYHRYLQEILAFEKEYLTVLKLLREKFLLESLQHSIVIIDQYDKNLSARLSRIKNISALSLQTYSDCLQEHFIVTENCEALSEELNVIIKKYKQQLKNLLQQTNPSDILRQHLQAEIKRYQDLLAFVEQTEIIAKRYIDDYFHHVKKETKPEFVVKSISNTLLSLGLWTGLAAATLTIAGFFCPILWVPASILGYISFASFGATAFIGAKMIHEGCYKRSPEVSDVRDLLIDMTLAPLALLGSSAISWLGNTMSQQFKSAAETMKRGFATLQNLWDNFFTNLTDLPDFNEANSTLKETFHGYDQVKNSKTAASWSFIKKRLALNLAIDDSIAIVKHSKLVAHEFARNSNASTQQQLGKASHYQFSYALFSNRATDRDCHIKQYQSYHQAILTLMYNLSVPKDVALSNAINAYQSLSPDASIFDRETLLQTINQALGDVHNYRKVKRLHDFVKLELQNIQVMSQDYRALDEVYLIRTRLQG